MYAIRSYYADPAGRLVFNLGKFEGEELEAHDVEIDNVSIVITSGEQATFDLGEREINNIKINHRITSYNVCYTKLLR